MYTLMDNLMDSFIARRGPINDREQFNEIYRRLFRSLMLNYQNLHDKSLERFLLKMCQENEHVSREQLKKSPSYTFSCFLLEFYHLAPAQAHFSDLCIKPQVAHK